MATYTRNIVTTVAYLIGIRKSILQNTYADEIENLELLFSDRNATVIRYLCKLRTALMMNFKKTDTEMKYNLTNIDKLEWFDRENIAQLEKWGFQIVKPNYTSSKYAELINRLISENIAHCRELFPEWLNWEYVKDLFIIPKFTQPNVMKAEFAKYMANTQWYPFQQYIHWNPKDCGGMLMNDKKFFNVLYEQHGDIFISKSNYSDADDEVKERIYRFIENSESVEIVVDCENSNSFKLCGVLTSLDSEIVGKIKKLILFDDIHTNPGWELVEKFVKLPVEHILVERVKEQKSLVDIKMTACVCGEHYKNNISSFILVSSDSDFWGLISSLPDAKFMMMFEYSKIGEAIKKTLSEHQIFYCAIDDFYMGRIDEFKRFVLFHLLKKYLPDIFKYNGRELVSRLYEEARINADQNEQNNFYKKYIQTLRFVADDDGNMRLESSK